ncbi:MAG: 3-dehydroquinate synthase family protein [Clostridia bacterium]
MIVVKYIYENRVELTCFLDKIKDKKIAIVYDIRTNKLFKEYIDELIMLSYYEFVLFGAEAQKSLTAVEQLYEYLSKNNFNRNDVIISVGGGIVSDMCGFVAMTYQRGMDYVSIPTTLLSMIDASIGGKNGVDFGGIKNCIGGFYEPLIVYTDTYFLNKLPLEEYKNGISELIKYEMISKLDILSSWIVNKTPMIDIIKKASFLKQQYIANDFNDKGERRKLNFGHTIGHAIEGLSGFDISHGQAVAYGMYIEFNIGKKFGYFNEEKFNELLKLYKMFDIDINIEIKNINNIAKYIENDKKVDGDNINCIFINNNGEAQVVNTNLQKYSETAIECIRNMNL